MSKKNNYRFSQQIIITGDSSYITTVFDTPLELDKNKKYEIALLNLETYYSIPNIDKTNNIFRFIESGIPKEVVFPEGCYELEDLNNTLKDLLKGDYVTIDINYVTSRAELIIKPNYKVDFTGPNTFADLLGFEKKMYNIGRHEGVNIVNITSISSLLIHLSIIHGSYLNNGKKPVIYSFFPNEPPGYKIIEKANPVVYLPLNTDTINEVTVLITDQNGKQVNIRGETITMRFHLRECESQFIYH